MLAPAAPESRLLYNYPSVPGWSNNFLNFCNNCATGLDFRGTVSKLMGRTVYFTTIYAFVEGIHFCVERIHFCVERIHFCVERIHFCIERIHFYVERIHFCVLTEFYTIPDHIDEISRLYRTDLLFLQNKKTFFWELRFFTAVS